MSGTGVCTAQTTELMQFFSSYLTDAMTQIAGIRNLVYELIEIDLPLAKAQPVASDILTIMAACKKTY